MEEAIATILMKLGSLGFRKIGDVLGVTQELKELRKTVKSIKVTRQLIEDARIQGNNPWVDNWSERLQGVCCDAKDLFDDFEYYALQTQHTEDSSSSSTTAAKVCRYLSLSSANILVFRWNMSRRIKEIRASLDRIRDDKDTCDLNLKRQGKGVSGDEGSPTLESFPCCRDTHILGRKGDTENILNFLLTESDSLEPISTIAIVGIGAIGKTTLAFTLYSDHGIGLNFQPRLWVLVKQKFNLKDLMRKMLASAGKPFDNLNTEQLRRNVEETVKGKDFLLVLDDVRIVDRVTWGNFYSLLSGGASGSKIIVTTRNHSVASIVSMIRPYQLQPLSCKVSTDLFVLWTFGEGQGVQNRKTLMEIGEEIVKKCNGVPGAIRTAAGLLEGKHEEHEWLRVKNSDFWKFYQTKGSILPVLRSSYEELPSYLKQCFVYFSTFPKDFEILVIELIYQWIAREFIQPSDETEELGKVGQEYIRELMSRSFLKDTDGYGYFSTLKMHDLVHDLAMSVAQTEYSIIDFGVKHVPENILHLSFSGKDILQEDEVPTPIFKLRKVRTVGFQFVGPSRCLVNACISRFNCLRMLGLRHSSFKTLPSSIGNLKYLKYLDLSWNKNIESLPDSICRLLLLETLMLQGCVRFVKLPKDVGKLTKLRCLRLTTQERCLSGKLIARWKALQCLWIDGCGNIVHMLDDEVIGNEHVLSTVSVLVIKNCKNLQCLGDEGSLLNKLENLVIVNCEKLDEGTIDKFGRGLTKLRFMWVGGLPKLVALPSLLLRAAASTLNHIRITCCSYLTTLPEDLECLLKLWIEACPEIVSLPHGRTSLAMMEELRISECPKLLRRCERVIGEEWHKISHVRDIYLDGINVQDLINNRLGL